MSNSPKIDFSANFNQASGAVAISQAQKKPKRPSPISIRITWDEKEWLKKAAGALAISEFCRQKIFGEDRSKRSKCFTQKSYEPSLDYKELAKLLGMFGQSELATSILALSLAATKGNIDITPALEEKIECACADIETIKMALILALGVKPQGD